MGILERNMTVQHLPRVSNDRRCKNQPHTLLCVWVLDLFLKQWMRSTHTRSCNLLAIA